jgi:hypothetical protein
MRDNFVLLIVFSRIIMKNCVSCKVKQRHIFSFLFVSCLTTVLLLGGLSVDDHQNGLLEVPQWNYTYHDQEH